MNKIDQFLLERYPTIWNTKIIWILAACLPVHLFFFVLGWGSTTEQELKEYHYGWSDYYFVIPFLLHFIIAILLIVGWLVTLFKHNSFKNFYPSSPQKLFGQFVQYFIIVFCCISFFISFLLGVKYKVNTMYSDKFIQDLEAIYFSERQDTFIPKQTTVVNPTEETNENTQEVTTEDIVSDNGLMQEDEDYYEMRNLVVNAKDIKETPVNPVILSHIPWAFFLSLLIFCFRVTNLRSLLFTIVFSGVLSLILGIFAFLIVLGGGGDEEGVFWLYILTAFSIIIGSVILLGGIRKLFAGILINFSLLYFVPAVFGVVGLTTDFAIFDSDYVAMNYLVFALGFVFIFLYTHILHKWRALPE